MRSGARVFRFASSVLAAAAGGPWRRVERAAAAVCAPRRLREEVTEQIRALNELKEMAAVYGDDLSKPATTAREAVQWVSAVPSCPSFPSLPAPPPPPRLPRTTTHRH